MKRLIQYRLSHGFFPVSLDYEGLVWLMAWQSIVYVPAPGQPWMGDPGSEPGMRGEDRIMDVGTFRPVCEKGPKRTPEPKTDRLVCKTPQIRTPERSGMGDSAAGARVCGATFELKHSFCILWPLLCFIPGYYPHLKHTLGLVGQILCFSSGREILGQSPG